MKKIMNYKFSKVISSLILGISYLAIGAFVTLLLISKNIKSLEIATWIIAVAGAITTSTIIIYYKQYKADHERSRRQMTIDLMMKWTDSLSTKTGGARKIVESLNDESCKHIYDIESTKIPKSQKSLLEGVLEKPELELVNDYYEITDFQASEIRGLVLTYLNALETVLTGWRLGISDKKIIEEEFSYLYDAQKNKGVLHNFRNIAGVHSYPSIDAFCKCLAEKMSTNVEVKNNVA